MKKFLIKMMTDRVEGYKDVAYAETIEEAKEYVDALKIYHNPIDVFYKYSD